MKTTFLLSILAISAIPAVFAQQPARGTDIPTAIPIYFGQFVTDIGDVHSSPLHVYSIPLSKGQVFSVTLTVAATDPAPTMQLFLFPPAQKTVADAGYGRSGTGYVVATGGGAIRSQSFSYTVATPGTYYVVAAFNSVGVNYTLQVTAVGTPQLQALPALAGCLTGQVDYITYSLQLIALNLPDTISVGGTQACAICNIKPPLYSQITGKLEKALASGLPVQACYDATGNIFQISLQHQ